MKVYLAAWFSSKELRKQQTEELRAMGIEVTSRWVDEKVAPTATMDQMTEDYLVNTAVIDMQDIAAADIVVGFTIDPLAPCHPRGGRHWEIGFAFGLGKEVVISGPKENIFHYLPAVRQYDSWEQTKEYLRTRNRN